MGVYIFGVGFCVAYPYSVGNAKAWNGRISDKYRSRALFIFMN
jgi:hypothetical protein